MLRETIISFDDVVCARLARNAAAKSRIGVEAAEAFLEKVQAARTLRGLAVRAVLDDPLWTDHLDRLTNMKLSGELDAIRRSWAYSGGFFSDQYILEYYDWRAQLRSFFTSEGRPIPAWLKCQVQPMTSEVANAAYRAAMGLGGSRRTVARRRSQEGYRTRRRRA